MRSYEHKDFLFGLFRIISLKRLIIWFAAYILALAAEISFLPDFFHSVPPISFSVLVFGIAIEGFEPGFWFAGLAGLSRDLTAPQITGSHVVLFLAVFFAVRAFASATHLDDPLGRIGKVAVGFVAAPVLWVLINASAGTFFSSPVAAVRWADMPRMFAAGDYLFIFALIIIFACISLRRFRRHSGNEFGRLSDRVRN